MADAKRKQIEDTTEEDDLLSKKPRLCKYPPALSICINHGDAWFYTDSDGNPRECVDCRHQKNATYRALNAEKYMSRASLPMDVPCKWHPDCTWWNTSGDRCGYCYTEYDLVNGAKRKDKDKGMISTMTRDYVRLCIGGSCGMCGYFPLLPQKEGRHPRQISFDRMDNTQPHSCDSNQTWAVCWQCNAGKWTYTVDRFYTIMCGIVSASDTNTYDTVTDDIVSTLEDVVFMKSKLQHKENNRCTNSKGKRFDPDDVVPFTLTVDEAIAQLRAQHHCCSLCHLSLSADDCSFDQTDSKNGYVFGKFTFMHVGCNSFKGEWSIEVAIETARRAVAFRNSKM